MMIIWNNSPLIRRRRWHFVIVFLFMGGAGRASAQGCTGVSNSTTDAVTWTPQWCQEFNGAPASPDTTAWNFDLGNNNGWGNNEAEVYCGPPGYPGNPPQCPTTFSTTSNTVYVDGNGHLVIQPIDSDGTWLSTRMNTGGIKNFQYGRIEASLQLPNTTNQGLWPAFWSLGSSIASGTPWPTCGEADFMENWSPQVFNGPGPNGNKSTIHTSLTGGTGIGGTYTFPSGQQADTAFHAYGVIWSPNMMQFYIDDATHPFLIKTTSDLSSGDIWPFNAQIFLLMNVAVGGNLGGSTSNLVNPLPLMADYVRVYSSSVVAGPTLGTPPSISVQAGATTDNNSTFTPELTPGTGFAYFSCSTDAPNASCAISTTDPLNAYVVNSSIAESVTVSVTTTANSILFPQIFNPKTRKWLPEVIVAFLALTIFAFALRLQSRAWRYNFTFVTGLILFGAVIASCGGNGTATGPTGSGGTPPGAYTVTVYAFTESNSSNGSNANADASVSIPLIVN
jgi:beta-glucanase (GH16 family)